MGNSVSRLNTFLRGIHVVDLSRNRPGPLATLLLADLGASILKIEPPQGDSSRFRGVDATTGRSAYYDALNAGKSIRCADLKNPVQRERVLAEIEQADVLVESYRPGVLEKLGLGSTTLREYNPGLIICSLSGFGQCGPLAQSAGYDANFLALAGVLHRNGSDRPQYFDPPVCDTTAALFAVISIIGALRARDRDGEGAVLDIALSDVMMPMQLMHLAEFAQTGHVPQPGTRALNGGAAYYQVYATVDNRHIVLGAMEEKFWRAFCAAANRPDWIPRREEPLPQHGLIAEVARFFGSLSLRQCRERFAAADCCVTPVLHVAETLASRHVEARGLVRCAPEGGLQALFPVLVDGAVPALRAPLKDLDQRNETDWCVDLEAIPRELSREDLLDRADGLNRGVG